MIGRILCLLGFHDKFSHAEDNGFQVPPRSHYLHPARWPGYEVETFFEWTRTRCRRCDWRFPQ